MATFIPTASGQSLRLRVFPRPAEDRVQAPTGKVKSLPLFPEAGGVSRSDAASDRLARQVVQLCLLNRVNAELIERFPKLGIQDWWLAGGCLFQTVWNLRSGRRAEQGIKDYDIIYFSDDLSEEAERGVIAEAADLCGDLNVKVQVRNQGRVHLWYRGKFGTDYPQLNSASEGILNFAYRASAIGLKRTGEEFLDLFAPFGLTDVWNFIVTPNRSIQANKTYNEKTARWLKEWPTLTVHPWAEEE